MIYALGLLASAGSACCASTPPPDANARNDEAVAAVRSGARTLANAAWWGFDRSDATRALQGAINSGAKQLLVPYMGSDWIVGPIKLASNQEILFEPGVVVMAKKNSFRGKHDCLFEGIEVHDVTLRGYGAAFRMRKADYRPPAYAKAEWRHALSFKGASRVKVFGLTLENSGGDGIYLGPTWDDRRIPCRNVTIKDCTCDSNHRQGISVVSAENVTIDNCRLLRTRGTAPQAGIDLEPGHPRDILAGVTVSNCVADGNAGSGFMTNLSRLNAQSQRVSVRISNCLVRNSRQPALRAIMRNESAPAGVVEFAGCTSENIEYSGATCIWKAAANLKLRFVNCKWRNVARRSSEAPIHLELRRKTPGAGDSAVRFVNCYVYDDKERSAVRCRVADPNVAGTLTVVNPHAGKIRRSLRNSTGRLLVRYVEQQD